ncbi:MAG: hypothetical protein ACOY0T_18680 [Myxococcota bacterium]
MNSPNTPCAPMPDGAISITWIEWVAKAHETGAHQSASKDRGYVRSIEIEINQREQLIANVFKRAAKRPKDLGAARVGRCAQGECRLVLASKPKSNGRTRSTQKGNRGRRTEDFKRSESAREPWLLATSLKCKAAQVIATYAKRMQLEEAFRDLKSSRFGWAFECVNSKKPARTQLSLMIEPWVALRSSRPALPSNKMGSPLSFKPIHFANATSSLSTFADAVP